MLRLWLCLLLFLCLLSRMHVVLISCVVFTIVYEVAIFELFCGICVLSCAFLWFLGDSHAISVLSLWFLFVFFFKNNLVIAVIYVFLDCFGDFLRFWVDFVILCNLGGFRDFLICFVFFGDIYTVNLKCSIHSIEDVIMFVFVAIFAQNSNYPNIICVDCSVFVVVLTKRSPRLLGIFLQFWFGFVGITREATQLFLLLF